MREILLRGKRIDNGEWIFGSLIHRGDYCCILPPDGVLHDSEVPYMDSDLGTFDGKAIPVDPETVGQYTGLTDKNGKRIFEWDILLPSKGPLQIHLLVVFLDFSWQMVFPSQKYYRHRLEVKDNGIYEVIGNIHENPELLGEVSDNGKY